MKRKKIYIFYECSLTIQNQEMPFSKVFKSQWVESNRLSISFGLKPPPAPLKLIFEIKHLLLYNYSCYQLLIKVDSRRSVQFCSPRIEVLFKIISAVSAGSMWLHKYHVHMIRMQLQKNFVPVVHCFRNVTNRRKADRGKWVW